MNTLAAIESNKNCVNIARAAVRYLVCFTFWFHCLCIGAMSCQPGIDRHHVVSSSFLVPTNVVVVVVAICCSCSCCDLL